MVSSVIVKLGERRNLFSDGLTDRYQHPTELLE